MPLCSRGTRRSFVGDIKAYLFELNMDISFRDKHVTHRGVHMGGFDGGITPDLTARTKILSAPTKILAASLSYLSYSLSSPLGPSCKF